MGSIIVGIILLALVLLALKPAIAHIKGRGGCCGDGSGNCEICKRKRGEEKSRTEEG